MAFRNRRQGGKGGRGGKGGFVKKNFVKREQGGNNQRRKKNNVASFKNFRSRFGNFQKGRNEFKVRQAEPRPVREAFSGKINAFGKKQVRGKGNAKKQTMLRISQTQTRRPAKGKGKGQKMNVKSKVGNKQTSKLVMKKFNKSPKEGEGKAAKRTKGKGKGKGGRKGKKGKGKGKGRSKGKGKGLNSDSLDKQLEDYMGPDSTKARLDADLDEYMRLNSES